MKSKILTLISLYLFFNFSLIPNANSNDLKFEAKEILTIENGNKIIGNKSKS